MRWVWAQHEGIWWHFGETSRLWTLCNIQYAFCYSFKLTAVEISAAIGFAVESPLAPSFLSLVDYHRRLLPKHSRGFSQRKRIKYQMPRAAIIRRILTAAEVLFRSRHAPDWKQVCDSSSPNQTLVRLPVHSDHGIDGLKDDQGDEENLAAIARQKAIANTHHWRQIQWRCRTAKST